MINWGIEAQNYINYIQSKAPIDTGNLFLTGFSDPPLFLNNQIVFKFGRNTFSKTGFPYIRYISIKGTHNTVTNEFVKWGTEEWLFLTEVKYGGKTVWNLQSKR